MDEDCAAAIGKSDGHDYLLAGAKVRTVAGRADFPSAGVGGGLYVQRPLNDEGTAAA